MRCMKWIKFFYLLPHLCSICSRQHATILILLHLLRQYIDNFLSQSCFFFINYPPFVLKHMEITNELGFEFETEILTLAVLWHR